VVTWVAEWAMSAFSWVLALGLLLGLIVFARSRLARTSLASADAAPPVPIARGAPSEPGSGEQRSLRAPASGDVLGQHQLLACVGEGGMARVWAARNVGSALQRLVAVKTALRDDDERTELRTSFMDEARIALLVRHPNVCGVNEFGEHEGILYQVMEWCDGASLRQVLDRLPEGRMDAPVAARIVAKVCAGLHAAHELLDDDGVPMHVVHRDVSPQNVLISTNGQVKVTDFGVAKADGQLHRAADADEVKGKFSYMAPEQVLGREVDRRADIFALGCILYEATTGRGPFAREAAPSTLMRLLSRPAVPPQTYVPDYPDELAAIALRALSKAPGDRYATAEQMGVALESWLAARSSVITERTIADLMVLAVGDFIRDKSASIDRALLALAPPASMVSSTLTLSAPTARPTIPARPAALASTAPARPTIPARPGAVARTSQPGQPNATARPTLPAGPAARKPGARR
jgi:serine/threonine protein kinase